MSRILRFVLAYVWILPLWLFFVYQVTAPELIVGTVASLVTAFAGYVTFRVVPVCFDLNLRSLAILWHLPIEVVKDLWLLLVHLLRAMAHKPSQSSFAEDKFHPKGDDCHAAAQRALALLFVSTTPNSVVLEIDRQTGAMLVHRAESAQPSKWLRQLEA